MRTLLLAAIIASTTVACSTSNATPLSGLYLALGDSLSEGVGASDRAHASFVALTHDELGPDVQLLNLGVAGHTSRQLIDLQLDRAVTEIQKRNRDADPANDVAVITLEIGGNDLLDLAFELVVPGICPNLSAALETPRCVNTLAATFEDYETNLALILDRLRAADQNLPIFLMTLFNPFSGGGSAVFDELGQLTLEGQPGTQFPDGLNDIIRTHAGAGGVHLVEINPLFEGKAGDYIAGDLIHPNDEGYQVMADAVLKSMRAAALID